MPAEDSSSNSSEKDSSNSSEDKNSEDSSTTNSEKSTNFTKSKQSNQGQTLNKETQKVTLQVRITILKLLPIHKTQINKRLMQF